MQWQVVFIVAPHIFVGAAMVFNTNPSLWCECVLLPQVAGVSQLISRGWRVKVSIMCRGEHVIIIQAPHFILAFWIGFSVACGGQLSGGW